MDKEINIEINQRDLNAFAAGVGVATLLIGTAALRMRRRYEVLIKALKA